MSRGEPESDQDDLRTRKTPDHELPSMRSEEMRTIATPDPTSFGGGREGAVRKPGSESATVPALEGGQLVNDKYHVVRRLAKGGFGAVYEGYYEINKNRLRVAIKVLLPQKEIDRAAVVRFDEEVKALCSLQHPNICRVLDGGIDPGTTKPFLVMDFCEGGSLKMRQQDAPEGRIEPRQAMVWMEEAARGLLAAERNVDEQGNRAPIHHRDIKPENLLLQRGRVVVADFGAARLSGNTNGVTSEVVPQLWTPAYGSPEQINGFADHRSDIYALGTTFFHLLTGQITARRFTDPDDRFRHPHDPCKIVPKLPRELGDLIRRMTEPDSAKRVQSFQEVLDALAAMQQRRASSWPLRLGGGLLLAAALFIGLESGGVIDVLPAKLIFNDSTLGELQQIDEQLQQRLTSLTPEPAVSWLSPLRDQVAEVRARLEANAQTLAPLLASLGGAASPPLPESYVKGLGAVLLELERSRRELAIAAIAGLEARFTSLGGDDGGLADLAAAADLLADEFRRCAEPQCDARAQALARRVRVAAAMLERWPQWSPQDAASGSPVDRLPELEAALQRLEQLHGEPEVVADRDLASWLETRSTERSAEWAARLLGDLQRQIGVVQRDVAAFNQRVGAASAAQMVELGRERAALEQRCAAIASRQREVRELARRHGLSGQLGEATSERIAPLESLASDLGVFRSMLTDAQYQADPETLREPLRQAARGVLQAKDALASALEAVPPDRLALTERQQDLVAAYDLLQRAERELDGYEAATKAMASRSVRDLRNACVPTAASRALPALEQMRAALERRVVEVDRDREAAVRALEDQLRGGTARLDEVRVATVAVQATMQQCGELELETRSRAVLASIAACAAVELAAPAWDGSELATFVATLPRLAAHGAELAADEPVRSWWQVRRQAIADGWCGAAAALWTDRHEHLAMRCEQQPAAAAGEALQGELAAYRQLAGELRKLAATRLGQSLSGASAFGRPVPEMRTLPIAPPVVIDYPDGWPDRSFLPPEGVKSLPLRVGDEVGAKLYTVEFLEQAERAGLRLWYFDKRRLKEDASGPGRVVYMVWCQSADGRRAALVDVHPVVAGEMWRYCNRIVGARPIWKDTPRETMAYYMTRGDAQAVVERASDEVGVRFSLPPDDLRDWPLAAAFGDIPVPVRGPAVHAEVLPGCNDVSVGGLCYLRYGVREWTQTSIVGCSVFEVAKSDAPVQKDSGVRLAIVLPHRDQ